jgi:catechol-2,3-dioxygenase
MIARAPRHDPEGRLMLNTSEVVCCVATARPTEAKHFYQEILGLPMLEDGPVALVFDANGTGARVAWFRDPDGNTLSLTQRGQGP